MMKIIFGMNRNMEFFFKLTLSFWVCATRHAQSTKILHIFEVEFLPTNKHEIFLQSDTITFGFA